MNHAKITSYFILVLSSLGSIGQSPGGVSSNLVMWFKSDTDIFSDAGTTAAVHSDQIEQWNDLSGATNNVTQTTSGSQPTYIATFGTGPGEGDDLFNGYPYLEFASGSPVDYLETSTPTGIIGDDGDYTKIVVHSLSDLSTVNALIGSGDNGPGFPFPPGHQLYYGQTTANLRIYHDTDITPISSGTAGTDVAILSTGRYEFTGGGSGDILYGINGSETTGTTSSVTYSDMSTIQIGAFINSFGLDGNITEVIIYNSAISDTDLNKVWSYLAIKYGIALDQSTAVDYTASNGTTEMWDKDASNASTYNNDLFGIGRDDGSGLAQSKSSSFSSDALVTIVNGTDFSTPTSIGVNNSFLTIANNNGTNAFGTDNILNADGSTSSDRLERIWQSQETGTIGNVTIAIPPTIGGLDGSGSQTISMVVDDSDPTFPVMSREVYEMSYNMTTDQYEVTANLPAGIAYFSFANASATTLPVELTYFSVEQSIGGIKLLWQTVSETNNSHFDIQRSINADEWLTIGTVQGNGNSNNKIDYSFIDNYSGLTQHEIIYYRLRQEDFDGSEEYSEIVFIELEGSHETLNQVVAYPNPVENVVNISASYRINHVSIINLSGQLKRKVSVGNKKTLLDLSDLKAGTYLLIVEDDFTKHNMLVKKL